MMIWEFKVKMSVAELWVADGFNAADRIEQMQDMIQGGLLPYAYGHEFKVNVTLTKKPDQKKVLGLQEGDFEPKD